MQFIALIWNEDAPDQQATAQRLLDQLARAPKGWQITLRHGGVCVMHVENDRLPSRSHYLDGGRGVVLGRMFRRGDPTDRCSPDICAKESERIVATEGRHLVDAYWGSYIAVLFDPNKRNTRLLCSPMCSISCLTRSVGGVQIYFSQMQDYLRLLPAEKLSINWRFVAAHLSMRTPPSETGLNEISTVSSGECVEHYRGGISRCLYWDAESMARLPPIENANEAADLLLNTTVECVHAWATCSDAILLQLSGGLDSSIVLGCLRDAPTRPRIAGFNYYSAAANSDERVFARMATEQAGCELIEKARNPRFDIQRILGAAPTEKPPLYLNMVGQLLPAIALAQEAGFRAMFNGHGGDEVFLNGQAELSAVDCFNRHGLGSRLFEAALGAAKLRGTTVWSVLRQSLKEGQGKRRWDGSGAIRQNSPLLNWAVVSDMVGSAHADTAADAAHIPPGKQYQISRLACNGRARCSPAFDVTNDLEMITPLRSQPLVELSLRIPTYVLISDGWDRALARRAFSSRVPNQILRRRWKGAQEGYTAEVFTRNLKFIRGMLLEGHLVREQLLDRRKVELALSGGPSNVMNGMNRISNHFAVEVWLQLLARHGITSDAPRQNPVEYSPRALAQA